MARDDDPLRALGLGPDADADDVRAARRRLARQVHPDAGGDNAAMASINDAAARALHELERPRDQAAGDDDGGATPPRAATTAGTMTTTWSSGRCGSTTSRRSRWRRCRSRRSRRCSSRRGWLGEVIDDDPPYRLDVHMTEPFECWCRFDVVPDAGASTVSLTVAAWAESPVAPVEQVRDVWVDVLNRLDWSALSDAAPPP